MTDKTLSPVYSLICGHTFLIVIIFTFYGFGFYTDNEYFSWGVPVTFLTYNITSETTFYCLLVLIFFHQLISNWIYEVVYPWIINTIQNPRTTTLEYSKPTCLFIVNMNSLYNQLHMAFIINGITSQVSFLIILVIADFLTLSYINWKYIKHKELEPIEPSPSLPPMQHSSSVTTELSEL
jgi:hypothetical protein